MWGFSSARAEGSARTFVQIHVDAYMFTLPPAPVSFRSQRTIWVTRNAPVDTLPGGACCDTLALEALRRERRDVPRLEASAAQEYATAELHRHVKGTDFL